MTTIQKRLVYGLLLVAGAILLVVLVGWGRAAMGLAGVGAGIGVWLGARAGNRRAKETDKYREEWLNRRKRPNGHPSSTDNKKDKNNED